MRTLLLALLSISGVVVYSLAPNIIWLQTDSMDGRLLDPTSSYYYKLKIEHIKSRLVDNGVTFARHYTNSPQCVPSRTALMTGRYAHEARTTNNGNGLARSTMTGLLDTGCVAAWGESECELMAAHQGNQNFTILDLLKSAGYDLQLFSRFDAGAGIIQDYPQHQPSGDGFHGGPSLVILGRGADVPGTTKEEPFNATSSGDKNPYEVDQATGDRVVDFLTNHDPASPSPFFLWMGLIAPHPPYDTNSTYAAHLNASNLDPGPPLPLRSAMHPFDARMSLLKNCLGADYTPAQLVKMRSAYWGAVAEAMEIVVRVLDAAGATGHLNNTVVIYTSDHGEMSLEHRQDYKNNLREPSTRVPFIIAPFNVPSLAGAPLGTVITNITSHIDVLPTLLDLAGVPSSALPPTARGSSLLPFLVPPAARSKEQVAALAARKPYAAAEYHSNLANTGSFMLRTQAYKLITFGHTFPWYNASSYTPQLFDLGADPFELTDVAPQHPDVVAELTATLEAEFGGTGALQRIDGEEMAWNFAQFNRTFFNLTTAELVARFTKEFKGVTPEEVQERVVAWMAAAAALLPPSV